MLQKKKYKLVKTNLLFSGDGASCGPSFILNFKCVFISGISIGGAHEEKKTDSFPELPQAPVFVNELAGGGSVR